MPTALDELVRLDLVRPEFGPSGSAFVFKHALIQEAAYGTLLLKRRRELHRRAADALESLEGARAPGRTGHPPPRRGRTCARRRLSAARGPSRDAGFGLGGSSRASRYRRRAARRDPDGSRRCRGRRAPPAPRDRSGSLGRFHRWGGGSRRSAERDDIREPRSSSDACPRRARVVASRVFRLPSRHPEPRGGAGAGGTIGTTTGHRRRPQSPVHRTHQLVGPPGRIPRRRAGARDRARERRGGGRCGGPRCHRGRVGHGRRLRPRGDARRRALRHPSSSRRDVVLAVRRLPVVLGTTGPRGLGHGAPASRRSGGDRRRSSGPRGSPPVSGEPLMVGAQPRRLRRGALPGTAGTGVRRGARASGMAGLGQLRPRTHAPRGGRRGRCHPRLGTGVGDGDRGRRHRHAGPRRRIPDRRAPGSRGP